MVVTPDTIVTQVDPHDMTEQEFRDVLIAAGSPAAAFAHDAYMILSTMPVSIAFLLAIFHHESGYGKAGITPKYETRNPGNCRSSRTGVGTVITTERGPFVKYPSWTEGWRDLAWRLVDPTYAYVKENRNTIREIIERFAPASDNNVPSSYINAVVRDMNEWTNGAPPMVGDDDRFAWVPDTSEFGYPQGTRGRNGKSIDYLIVHVTEGTDSLGWLNGNNGSSAHYLTHHNATPRAQMVREADAAWTAGNRDYNERGINIEFERFAREAWGGVEYQNAARTCHPILKRNNIPLDFLGRLSNGRRGIIGHEHVPDPDGSGWGGTGNHTDPGNKFDWSRFMAELRALEETTPPINVLILNNIPVTLGFLDHFLKVGEAVWSADPVTGGIAVFGLPLAPEYATAFGSAQRFERYVMEWWRDNAPPFDTIGTIRGQKMPEEVR